MFYIREIMIFQVLINYLNADIRISKRIIGGLEAAPHEFSFIIGIKDMLDKTFVCAGSLLNEFWVITAAHCTDYNYIHQRFQIFGGMQYSDRIDNNVQIRKISKFVKHEKTNLTILPFRNDIALIKVDKPFRINNYVKPVKYDTIGPVIDIRTDAIGWGSTSNAGIEHVVSKILHKVTLPIIDDKSCENFYRNHAGIISETMFCAGFINGGKATCVGDSGGPIIQNGMLVGIVTSGPKHCALKNSPPIFTKISYFKDWIEKHIKE